MIAASAALLAGPAHAQSHDQALIGGHAGTGSEGRIAVNQAAGVGNAQANLAALAHADSGLGIASAHAMQKATPAQRAAAASATIDGGAFNDVSGALSLNQAAGTANLQLNTIAIGTGGLLLAHADDAALANTTGSATSTEGAATATPDRRALIDIDAFRGSQGVVQVNQTAGVGNLSTNAIVLQLPGGTP
ncbi:hypothetical protein IP90_03094 [Luteimonas cucumeris]|uniref:Uncharacterized protein n=1 Tax=Luteimonas cucumeris TaxID=985012 RepID=A0A562KVM4_9GAMM|nr:hypothetical protein [Luteimonas cucumeris]TWH99479.1 hypothetical protein IP90_03094 [Luteimonas cucumeris]